VPAADPYATLAELKADLGITDVARDARLTSLLARVSAAVDAYCGRVGATSPGAYGFGRDADAVARVFNPTRRVSRRLDGELLLLDDVADAGTMTVETGTAFPGPGGSWSPLDTALFDVWPENAAALGLPVTGLLAPYGWVLGVSSRVRVTAKWGWPAVPGPVAEATLRWAARLFTRSSSPEGVLGSAEWGTVRVARVDPDVAAQLGPYMRT
jgi:hypothetical protein